MGYINDNPAIWHAKRMPTADEMAQLKTEFGDRLHWNKTATKSVKKWSKKLGYDFRTLQSPRSWLGRFAKELCNAERWSERRSILQFLSKVGEKRADRILHLLYLFAQHRRIQLLAASMEPGETIRGEPFNELEGNHHNLDNLLLRLIVDLCNDQDRLQAGVVLFVRKMVARYLGPPAGNVTPNRVAGWARIGECAAGISPRDVGTLAATYRQTAAPAWKGLQRQAFFHLREASAQRATAATWESIAVWVVDLYGVYFAGRFVFRLFHF